MIVEYWEEDFVENDNDVLNIAESPSFLPLKGDLIYLRGTRYVVTMRAFSFDRDKIRIYCIKH